MRLEFNEEDALRGIFCRLAREFVSFRQNSFGMNLDGLGRVHVGIDCTWSVNGGLEEPSNPL